ncbi:MAG TPA: hypothetical protein VFX16_36650 [Pseudonocardiaceae bacterium]|nr:hypothetical protein [Pseudonocardiaceae bacterium]
MSRQLSPAGSRDLVLVGLLAAALALLFALAGALMLSAATVTAMVGGPWRMPPVTTWASTATSVLADPGRPAVSLGQPWAPSVAAHPTMYWALTSVIVAAAMAVLVGVGLPVWRRVGPSPAGHASREDIRRELSPGAARITAEWTRPSLSATQRRRAPLDDISAPLHRGPHREVMVTPLENPTGALAPTQSGKTRKDLVHKALAAPGALLCSTTKPDLLEFTALSRTRRPQAGPVLVYDATGTVAWPARLRWSPITGCERADVARRRAHTMVEASAVDLTGVDGNDRVFRDRAKTVLQAYLLAAASYGRDVNALVRWSTGKPPDQEPVKLLTDAGYPDLARNLRTEIGMVAETSDAVWMSVRRCLEPLMDPRLRDLCTPGPDDAFGVYQGSWTGTPDPRG